MEEQEWISLDERLPEVGMDVLCYSRNRGIVRDDYTGKSVHGKHWFSGDGTEYDNEVTHWMPLPQPPTT